MKGLFIPLVLSAAIIGLVTAGPTTAQESPGTQESLGTNNEIEKNDNVGVDQNDWFCPADSSIDRTYANLNDVQARRNSAITRRLVSYLAYTSVRLTEDIRFEMKGMDGFKILIDNAETLSRNTGKLRAAIVKGASLVTIEESYDAVTLAYRKLDRRLHQYDRMRLVDESLFRVGRMLASFDRALAFGNIVGGETPRIVKPNDRLINIQPAAPGTGNMPSSPKPVEPQLIPPKTDQPADQPTGQPNDPKLPPVPTIPKTMKGISLLLSSE